MVIIQLYNKIVSGGRLYIVGVQHLVKVGGAYRFVQARRKAFRRPRNKIQARDEAKTDYLYS